MMRPSKNSKELADAIAEDRKRHEVDAAKKRAVAQQADYDMFKKLVSVAHLKPLHAPSAPAAGTVLPAWQLDLNHNRSNPASLTNRGTPLQDHMHAAPQQHTAFPVPHSSSSYSSSTAGGTAGGTSHNCPSSNALAGNSVHIPRNSAEFAREWRRTCTTAEAKYRLLQLCGAEAMTSIFKVEITGELLGQMLLVLHDQWARQAAQQQKFLQGQEKCPQQHEGSSSSREAEDSCVAAAMWQEAVFVVQLLYCLTGAGRFDLNARLIGSKAKQAGKQLCEDLAAAVVKGDIGSSRHGTSSSCSKGSENVGETPRDAGDNADEKFAAAVLVASDMQEGLHLSMPGCDKGLAADVLQKLDHVRCKLYL